MKKYILTIKYDENTDEVEWMQEEIINYITKKDTDFLHMTSDELRVYCKKDSCAKA